MVEGLHRVVVTGLGAITPIGNTVEEYWDGLTCGRNGVAAISLFDASAHACRFAAEVKNFDPKGFLEPKESKRWDRFSKFGVIAAKEALNHSGLIIDNSNSGRIGVIIGSGVGGLLTMETQAHVLDKKGASRVSPFTVPMMIPNMATGLAAIALGARGPSSAVSTACAAGSNAIGDAFRLLQLGKADAMVCGGAEASITPLGVAGFASAKALSFRNEDPSTASRPFDSQRDGFVIAGGGGTIVLEELQHAKARGANIYGEITGYGATSDGFDMVQPSGEGAMRCMQQAMQNNDKIDYLNAHGTSTPVGDMRELEAVREVFGANTPRITSTKSLTGHSLGVAGVHEAIYTILMLQNDFISPSINIENLDENAAGFNIVTDLIEGAGLEIVMSNSFGFGGTNASLVFKK